MLSESCHVMQDWSADTISIISRKINDKNQINSLTLRTPLDQNQKDYSLLGKHPEHKELWK